MVFTPPPSVSTLPSDPPDSISIAKFISNESYGRLPFAKSRNPYTCGITGKSYTALEVIEREDYLSRALGKELNFDPSKGSEWDRVVAIFSLNTIDYIPITHAVHRLNGIVTPVSFTASAAELEQQLRSSKAKALVTCEPLIQVALEAAKRCGLPDSRIFLLELPNQECKAPFKTVTQLVDSGKQLPEVPSFQWPQGQGAKQVAYLCYSSGTSGLPKAVMISHRNIIANVLQMTAYESAPRNQQGVFTQAVLGALPFSHIYGLVPITHLGAFRGDEIIVLPRFELTQALRAVARFKIEQLCVVPPILVQMLNNADKCKKHNLESVRFVYTGAAPLGQETVDSVRKMYPKWHIGQGYGLTETATVVTSTNELDIWDGSIGTLIPDTKAKIIASDGSEVTSYDTPGELLIQSPSVVLGYMGNEKATSEAFFSDDDGRWLRTGDEVLVRVSPSGDEHFFVVDRIKELIKVNGHQVAPAELEAHLLSHSYVADCAVIQVPDPHTGELPKAFIVKAKTVLDNHVQDKVVLEAIHKHVEENKARHKWLKGGIEFVQIIPKSPSGKILRRLLRDKERESRRVDKAKI
ncbi:hypothetical protein FAUST_10729 [Fusarium austroamericanum]|uniref:Phenylacetyl-CoA ligase n=1 Tax=Fusarium austroamericanum TaxID=282268 RepID=A0AAN5Z1P7_FUSAU|nr:hypothetical protein FAUST_10729 [Fusarium austroamericanum]